MSRWTPPAISSWSGRLAAIDGAFFGIVAQRFNGAGVPQGPEFVVNTHTTNNQVNPAVAMNPAGNFVVVWESAASAGGDLVDLHAQRYNAAGVAQGTEFA